MTPHERLRRAEAAVAAAVADHADPWRVAELRLRYDRALAEALAAEALAAEAPDAEAPDAGPPRPRRGHGGV